MKKLNESGFVLAETLIATVFLTVIFSMIYVNYYPLIAEYEKREVYDDVDGKYVAYWVKKIIENDSFGFSSADADKMNDKGYIGFKCTSISDVNQRSMCINIMNSFNIADDCSATTGKYCAYITHYRIGGTITPNFKDTVNSDDNFAVDFKDYVNYLPDFATGDPDNNKYRVIVVVRHQEGGNDYRSYSTMEVNK